MPPKETIMKDTDLSLATSYVSFSQDEDIRSPRTPTYAPDQSFISMMTPFDAVSLLRKASLRRTTLPKSTELLPPLPPKNPLKWVWQCHLCRTRWHLGATRRCLIDGHYYCSGETGQPNLKKKKGRSCSSEFDYLGWQEWGQWKQRVLASSANSRLPVGCEKCEFPSQCRYPKDIKVVGGPPSKPATDNLTASAEEDITRYYSNENVTSEPANADAEKDSTMRAESKGTDPRTAEKKARSSPPSPTAQSSRPPPRKPVRKNTLSPIGEDALNDQLSNNGLFMPVLAYLKEKKEH